LTEILDYLQIWKWWKYRKWYYELLEERARIQLDLSKCKEENKKKSEYLDLLKIENDNLSNKVASLEKDLTECVLIREELKDQVQSLNKEVIELKKDVKYYEERITKLTEALASSIVIPDISQYIMDRRIINPYKIIRNFNILCADLEYYMLPLEQWKKICTLIQAEVKKVLETWKPEISDCDNWSLVMNSFVSIAFKNCKIDRQGAFSMVWSYTHAYNLFVSYEGIYIYEPQNNRIVGRFLETSSPYDSKIVWFPLKKV